MMSVFDNPVRFIILLGASIFGMILVTILTRSFFRKKIGTLSAVIIAIFYFTLTAFFTVISYFFEYNTNSLSYSCHVLGTLAIYFFAHRIFGIYIRKTLIIFSLLSIGMIIMHFLTIEYVIFVQIPFSFYIYGSTYWRCSQTRNITTSNQTEILINLKHIQQSMVWIFFATLLIIGGDIIFRIIGNTWHIYTVVDTVGWACSPFFVYYAYHAYKPSNSLEKQSALLQIRDLSILNNDLNQMVNEQQISEQELRERIIELRNINQMRSEFFASFSHELRTPLNGIIGFTELLLDNRIDKITDNQRDILNDVAVSGKHLLSIIENVLDISKLESGKFTIVSSDIDLSILMAEVAQICYFRSRQKHITTHFSTVPSLKIWGDFQRLKQVLINIIDNAIKYSPDNTSIDIFMTVMNGDIQFKVIDHGHGIPREKIPTLFHPYQRAENYAQCGWGMGLYYSKQIIDLHHGTINIESEVKKGTTITVIIPRTK